MTDLASVADLELLMKRTFTGADLDQADMVLSAVSAWARAVSGQEWPDAPVGVPSDVKYVVLAATRRVLTNPDGVVSESMGPFSKTYEKQPVDFFMPAEVAILKRYRPSPRLNSGLFTVGFSRGERATPFVNYVRFGSDGEKFPCFWQGDPGYIEEVDPLD